MIELRWSRVPDAELGIATVVVRDEEDGSLYRLEMRTTPMTDAWAPVPIGAT